LVDTPKVNLELNSKSLKFQIFEKFMFQNFQLFGIGVGTSILNKFQILEISENTKYEFWVQNLELSSK